MSFISVVTPTFNEGENIRELCSEVEKIFQKLNSQGAKRTSYDLL